MAFFRTINFTEPLPSIPGEGVTLRTPQMTDYAEWSALPRRAAIPDAVGANLAGRRSHPQRVPAPDQALCGGHPDRPGYSFLIVRNGDGALVGGLTLANIRRGVAQAAQRRLLAGAAVCAPRPHDGGGEGGHSLCLRSAAAAPPGSGLHPDQRRLEPAPGEGGFVREGYAREYLCINGTWQDHLLYADYRTLRSINHAGLPPRDGHGSLV